MKRVFYLILIITSLTAAQTGTSLKLNEIMFYPASGNNEFIELYNTSLSESININGYKIKYSSSSADIISDAGEGTSLQPLSYAVIFENDYDLISGIYNNLVPTEALIVKISDNSFGSTGMSNTADRPIWLISAAGDTLDTYTYSADNAQTYSDEKIYFQSDSSQSNWANSIVTNGTPGFRNSVTPLEFDLGISSVTILPEIPLSGDNITIDAKIKNNGENTAGSFTIQIFNDINLDSIPQINEQIFSQQFFDLSPDDSISASTGILSAAPGLYNIIVKVIFTEDENNQNNTAFENFTVYQSQNNYNDIVINEIMYAPSSGEPEWVEIYNRSFNNVNLYNWKFSDNSHTVLITDQNIFISPRSYFVLTKDSSILNYYSVPSAIIEFNLPALNNTGDAVVIKDTLGIIIDSLVYLPDWGGNSGRSLERINIDDPGNQQSNWKTSESIYKATPGKINSVTPKENDLKISSFKPASNYGIAGEPAILKVEIKNVGLDTSPGFSISLFNDINQDSIPQISEFISLFNSGPVFPGDSIQFMINSNPIQPGINYFISKLSVTPDEDTTNNIALTEVTGVQVNEIRNDLIINEFMYAPSSPQPEWVEIFNRSNKVINMKNYRIADERDTIKVDSNPLLLKPGNFVVIASDSSITEYFYIPSALIIKSLPALNNTGDKIILIDSLCRVIDSLEYVPLWGGKNGRSLERISCENPSNNEDNWGTSVSRYNATPGYLNSITPKAFDISVSDIISSPQFPVLGDNVSLKVKVNNSGMKPADYSIRLYEDNDLDSLPDVLIKTIEHLSIMQKDSAVIETGYTVNNIQNTHLFYAKAVFDPDMDTSNNYYITKIFPGYPSSTIVINEIMYSPAGGEPEWVEIYNTSKDSIDLKNWKVNDVLTNPSFAEIKTSFIIPPENYIVLTKDSSIFNYHRFIPSSIIKINLPVLNNDMDGFVLRDPRGQIMDSVFFNSNWGGTDGYSLERISTAVGSNVPSNWGSSDDIEFSTPGRINGITPKAKDVIVSKISSVPEYPVEGEVFVSAWIKNKGSREASDLTVEFYYDSDSNNVVDRLLSSQPGISISAEDSLYIVSKESIVNLSSGKLTAVRVIFRDDEDSLNNYAERFVQYGFANQSILINEIMYNPEGDEPEWFELKNNSSMPINLKNWSASDLLTSPVKNFITGSDYYILPYHFIVVAKDTSFNLFHPDVHEVLNANFGTLGNSEDGVVIYDFRDAVIDSVHYKSNWDGKKGRSIERISVTLPSNDSSNWTASLNPAGSTPGKENSVINIPQFNRNSLVINEIMYDPGIDNCEFIEFFNCSKDSINIGGWRIEDEKRNFYKLSDTIIIINPGNYFLFSSDSIILNKYAFKDFKNISFAGSPGLGLSNSGELILLKDVRGTIMDSVFYSSGWNNKNINFKKNKSLERINPALNGNYPQNWSTCVDPEGATPGKQNSIFTENKNNSSKISVTPNPFSPDNDGFEDFSIINYSLTRDVSQIRIKIFDNRGRLVRTLVNNQSSASHGSIIFDGLDDDGQPLRMGIYIIYLEAADGRGKAEILKTVVVIARKL